MLPVGVRSALTPSSWRSERATVVNEDRSLRVNCVGKGEPVDNQKPKRAPLRSFPTHPVDGEGVKFVQQGQKGR